MTELELAWMVIVGLVVFVAVSVLEVAWHRWRSGKSLLEMLGSILVAAVLLWAFATAISGCASSSGRSTHPTSYRAGYIPPATTVPPRPAPTVPYAPRDAASPTTIERVGDQIFIRRGADLTIVRCDPAAQLCVIE